MHKYTVAAFENQDQTGSFLTNIKEQASDLPFLAQLETATVTVNGKNPLDDDTSSYPPPTSSSSQNTEDRDLAMWQIALIAGFGAFVLVLVAALTFICCMKVDPEDPNYRRCGGDSTVAKKTLAVQTLSTTRVDSSIMDKPSFDVNDCALSCKSPSPVRSITSQDSSIFTYNPRSVRSAQTGYSLGGTYFTSNSNVEMDLAAWQGSAHLAQIGGNTSPHVQAQPANLSSCFGDGNDISAIESALSTRGGMHDEHRDLSLIQEEDPLYSSSIAASSPSTTPDHRNSNAVTESALNELVNMERGRMSMIPSVAAAYMSSNRNNSNNHSPDDNTELVEAQNRRSARGRRLTVEGQIVRNELEELSYQIDSYRTQPY